MCRASCLAFRSHAKNQEPCPSTCLLNAGHVCRHQTLEERKGRNWAPPPVQALEADARRRCAQQQLQYNGALRTSFLPQFAVGKLAVALQVCLIGGPIKLTSGSPAACVHAQLLHQSTRCVHWGIPRLHTCPGPKPSEMRRPAQLRSPRPALLLLGSKETSVDKTMNWDGHEMK